MAHGVSRGWLLAAIIMSVAVVSLAPMVGQMTAVLRDLAQEHYALTLVLIVAVSALATIGGAAYVIRERRVERYSWIVASVGVAVSYGFATRTGIADADAAERFHFIQYGLIAFLFYKAWRPAGDGVTIMAPLLATVLVGTVDEWFQWFVPARVGEAKDVVLNLFSGAAGVLFALGVDPLRRVSLATSPASRRHLSWLVAATVAVFAAFFHSVHLGHEIADRDAGVFRSRYSAAALREVSESRSAQWQRRPPLTWSRYSREDQYLTEGIAHVRRRNQRWDEGNVLAARHENLILEKYYSPVLDTPSYIAATGHRWPADQRAEAERVRGPGFMIYESDALDYLVVTWPPSIYWLVVTAAILLILRRIP
jgi:hypothetical protein